MILGGQLPSILAGNREAIRRQSGAPWTDLLAGMPVTGANEYFRNYAQQLPAFQQALELVGPYYAAPRQYTAQFLEPGQVYSTNNPPFVPPTFPLPPGDPGLGDGEGGVGEGPGGVGEGPGGPGGEGPIGEAPGDIGEDIGAPTPPGGTVPEAPPVVAPPVETPPILDVPPELETPPTATPTPPVATPPVETPPILDVPPPQVFDPTPDQSPVFTYPIPPTLPETEEEPTWTNPVTREVLTQSEVEDLDRERAANGLPPISVWAQERGYPVPIWSTPQEEQPTHLPTPPPPEDVFTTTPPPIPEATPETPLDIPATEVVAEADLSATDQALLRHGRTFPNVTFGGRIGELIATYGHTAGGGAETIPDPTAIVGINPGAQEALDDLIEQTTGQENVITTPLDPVENVLGEIGNVLNPILDPVGTAIEDAILSGESPVNDATPPPTYQAPTEPYLQGSGNEFYPQAQVDAAIREATGLDNTAANQAAIDQHYAGIFADKIAQYETQQAEQGELSFGANVSPFDTTFMRDPGMQAWLVSQGVIEPYDPIRTKLFGKFLDLLPIFTSGGLTVPA